VLASALYQQYLQVIQPQSKCAEAHLSAHSLAFPLATLPLYYKKVEQLQLKQCE